MSGSGSARPRAGSGLSFQLVEECFQVGKGGGGARDQVLSKHAWSTVMLDCGFAEAPPCQVCGPSRGYGINWAIGVLMVHPLSRAG